ncbi:MAG: transposase [Alphaproteobacteria bacterium]|nr:transposase [Alphaproteobacteria bacterium]
MIGSIRRARSRRRTNLEYLDHIIVLNAAHLRRVLKAYVNYYNSARTHLSLDNNAPLPRSVKSSGIVRARSHLGAIAS